MIGKMICINNDSLSDINKRQKSFIVNRKVIKIFPIENKIKQQTTATKQNLKKP